MKQPSNKLKVTFLARFVMFVAFSGSIDAWAENEKLEFDSSFLMGPGSSSVDLSRYSDGNIISQGIYDASAYVNNELVNSLKVEFIETGDKRATRICITPKMLSQLHIRLPDEIPAEAVWKKRREHRQLPRPDEDNSAVDSAL